MSDPKYAYRLPPCPDYDLEGMESWLESMAQKGLILSKEGSFAGFTIFEKQEPRSIRYRLQPFRKRETAFSDGGPEEAAVELAEDFGWQLVTTRSMYAVYCTEDSNAPELDTDPAVQAMNLQQRIRRCRRELLVDLALALVLLAVVMWEGMLTFLLDAGQWYLLTLHGIWLLALGLTCSELQHLKKLRNKLLSGGALSRQQNLSRRRWLHTLRLAGSVLLLLGFWIAMFANNIFGWKYGRWQPAEDADLPFADMGALVGGGEFVPNSMADRPLHYAQRSTLLAEEQIEFQQWGEVIRNSVSVIGGSLDVSYAGLRSEWLAEQLFDEWLRDGTRSRHFNGIDPLPQLDADEAAAFTDIFPVLLLRDGNRVLRVEFAQYGAEEALSLQEWQSKMTESFLSQD